MWWVTELSGYDISTSLCGQGASLNYFQVETTMLEEETPWHVFVDGLFTTKGSGVSVVLVSP